ncbi:PepSY domain-containing protein [Shewanella sp. Isolate11]|uniref:PepSY domain-containing protein n=1 Tax=Shewanella sp. Isolate11 TaxID=2908530 RepID=UPI001EFD0607|nr:PepSY domain-containing protein [Shewanella sp. Isolate11]MCG9698057.1 PepSY domain-containing protein [Shewanella sp. Isolate11]
MARWFISFLLVTGLSVTGCASANTTLLSLLSDDQSYTPQMMIAQVEQDYPGIVTEIEAEEHKGELVYEVSVINIKDDTEIELEFSGKDGKLLKQKVQHLDANDDELKAAQLLNNMQLSFSTLVKQAMGDSQAHIQEAQLDHDLGISYLELKLIDENGKRKVAYDIKNQRPLPLLKWD